MIEILVVVAIIGVLIAMLLPAVQQARESARRTQCTNNLRQLALAAHNFHLSRGSFPPGLHQLEVAASPRYRGTSLFAYLLPFIEQGVIGNVWDYNYPMNNTLGGPDARSAVVIATYVCPSDQIVENPVVSSGRYFGMTSYGGNGGLRSYDPDLATLDGLFHTTGPASLPKPNQKPVTSAMILDGTSNTLMFGERNHYDPNFETFAAASWTTSLQYLGTWAAIGGRKRIGDVVMSAFAGINYHTPCTYDELMATTPGATPSAFTTYEDMRLCAWGSNHPGGANFALADGSARFVSEMLPQPVLQAISTRSGAEPPVGSP